MTIQLTHPFIHRCIDKDDLLYNVSKFNTFANRLEKQSKKAASRGMNKDKSGKQKVDEKSVNEYKGWGFELFSEALIKMFAFDKRIGIKNYTIGEEDEDVGVDGHGVGINGKPATVQIKYRQANYILTTNNDHLTNFTYNSMRKFKVENEDNMLIITSGKGLHWHTSQNMIGSKVKCINREKIRILVDDNMLFWNELRESWTNALNKT